MMFGRHIYIYLEPKWPLFLKVNPPKQGRNSNQNKGPHLGSRYIFILLSSIHSSNRSSLENKPMTDPCMVYSPRFAWDVYFCLWDQLSIGKYTFLPMDPSWEIYPMDRSIHSLRHSPKTHQVGEDVSPNLSRWHQKIGPFFLLLIMLIPVFKLIIASNIKHYPIRVLIYH